MSKPMKNGHDAPKTCSQSQAAIRMRRFKERKRRGALVIRDIVIEPDLVQALIGCGWLHGIEANNREAIENALLGLVLRSLQSGVTPSGKPLIEIDLDAVKSAWIWARPGSALTPENAARALSNVAKCSKIVNFSPTEFSERLRQMAGIG